MEKTILFQNSNYLAVFKETGVLSVPSRMREDDERPCLLRDLQSEFGVVLPVHRLDFEVSGILLFARTKDAQRIATRWFEEKSISKTYQAFSEKGKDVPAFKERQVWKSKLVRGKKRSFEAAHGKESITEAMVVGERKWIDPVSRDEVHVFEWNLRPLTGRSHQLRYEMFKHGFPILGDQLYGSSRTFKNGIALRAISLDFELCKEAKEMGLPIKIQMEQLCI